MSMRIRLLLALTLLGSLFAFAFASAWTGPTAAAPGNNAAAPINVGSANQVKNANLGLNGLVVFGNTELYGSGSGGNAYPNFGTTPGPPRYGIFDNGGTLNFKNSGGSWQSLQSIVSSLGGLWTQSGSSIYYNTGNVGIGAASPGAPLQVGSNSVNSSSGRIRSATCNSNCTGNRAWDFGAD